MFTGAVMSTSLGGEHQSAGGCTHGAFGPLGCSWTASGVLENRSVHLYVKKPQCELKNRYLELYRYAPPAADTSSRALPMREENALPSFSRR